MGAVEKCDGFIVAFPARGVMACTTKCNCFGISGVSVFKKQVSMSFGSGGWSGEAVDVD